MPPKKRAAETIDLTDDEPTSSSQPYASSSQSHGYGSALQSSPHVRAHKQARTSTNHRSVLGNSQHDPVFIDDDDEDNDASQEVPGSSQGCNEQQYSWTLYGTMHTKVVGVRYYSGYATMGEMATPRREPSNQYDRTMFNLDSLMAG